MYWLVTTVTVGIGHSGKILCKITKKFDKDQVWCKYVWLRTGSAIGNNGGGLGRKDGEKDEAETVIGAETCRQNGKE